MDQVTTQGLVASAVGMRGEDCRTVAEPPGMNGTWAIGSYTADHECRQGHVLRVELDVMHDEDADVLLAVVVSSAKAALEARGVEVWGSGGTLADQPTWLYRTARDLGQLQAPRNTVSP
ncbi:MAG: hypothetical protein QOF81_555 [Acidimicrobiaceae bacterium]|nr:hypothetical protein [Acidimicrobiaceae bacterium]